MLLSVAAPAVVAAATTGTGHSDILNFTFGFGVASFVRWAARKRRAARTKGKQVRAVTMSPACLGSAYFYSPGEKRAIGC